MSLEYLDPVAEPTAPQEPYLPRLAAGTASPRIAMFPNLFADSREFLGDVAASLTARRPGAAFPFFDKKYGRYMASPGSDELRDEIMAASDATVLAYGHCGSCTSGTVHDAVLLARRGAPVCAFVTERFREEALFLASALGLPGLPFIFLPHPVAGQTAEWQQALADFVAPMVMRALETGVGADASGFAVAPEAQAECSQTRAA